LKKPMSANMPRNAHMTAPTSLRIGAGCPAVFFFVFAGFFFEFEVVFFFVPEVDFRGPEEVLAILKKFLSENER